MFNFTKNYLVITFMLVLLFSVYKSSIYRTVLLKRAITNDHLSFQLLVLRLKDSKSYNYEKDIKIENYEIKKVRKSPFLLTENDQPTIKDDNDWEFLTSNKIEIRNYFLSRNLGFFKEIKIKNSILNFRKNIDLFSDIYKEGKYSYQESPMNDFLKYMEEDNLFFMPLFCYATYDLDEYGFFNGFNLNLTKSGFYFQNSVFQVFDFYLDEKKFPFNKIETVLTASFQNNELFFNIIFKDKEYFTDFLGTLNLNNQIDVSKLNNFTKKHIFWSKMIKVYGGYNASKHKIGTENSKSGSIEYTSKDKFIVYCQILINDFVVSSKNYEVDFRTFPNYNFVSPCMNTNVYKDVLFCQIKQDPTFILKTFKKLGRKYMTININFTCN